MRVSIVIPIYNAESHILRGLSSVATQSFQDIECILVDDKSKDKSIQICHSFAQVYQGGIKFIVHSHAINRGVAAARNTGTELATGDFVFYMDSDDELPTDAIRTLVAEAENHPQADIIYGSIIIDNGKERKTTHYEKTQLNSNSLIRQDFFSKKRKTYGVVWNKLIKREFIDRNRLSFREGIIHEDELWMYHAISVAKSFCFSNETTYIQHVIPTSIMSTLSQEWNSNCWLIVLKEILPLFSDPCYDKQVYKYLDILFSQCIIGSKEFFEVIGLFAQHSKKCHLYKLFFALKYYKWSVKNNKGEGVKNWIFHYALNQSNYGESLVKAIYYDFRAVLSSNLKRQ